METFLCHIVSCLDFPQKFPTNSAINEKMIVEHAQIVKYQKLVTPYLKGKRPSNLGKIVLKNEKTGREVMLATKSGQAKIITIKGEVTMNSVIQQNNFLSLKERGELFRDLTFGITGFLRQGLPEAEVKERVRRR